MTSFSVTRLQSSPAAAKAILADVTIVMAGSPPFEPPQKTVSAVGRSTSSRLGMPDLAQSPEFTPRRGQTSHLSLESRHPVYGLSLGSPCPSCPSCLIFLPSGSSAGKAHRRPKHACLAPQRRAEGTSHHCCAASRPATTRSCTALSGLGLFLRRPLGRAGAGWPRVIAHPGSHRSVHARIRAYGSSGHGFAT